MLVLRTILVPLIKFPTRYLSHLEATPFLKMTRIAISLIRKVEDERQKVVGCLLATTRVAKVLLIRRINISDSGIP